MKVIKNESENPGPISNEIIEECFELLCQKKSELLNRKMNMRQEHLSREIGGDEVDLSLSNLDEHRLFAKQEHLLTTLAEIEHALARMELGTFGICEETGEYIETNRLRAIPWTRLSIEGAEIREALKRRFAR